MKVRSVLSAGFIAATLALVGCGGDSNSNDEPVVVQPPEFVEEKKAILVNYAEIAHKTYSDALTKAEALDAAIVKFLAEDSTTAEDHKAVKAAYRAARVPYQQSEAFRFDEGAYVTDALDSVDEQEGNINAWPLDEGLIDYVDLSTHDEKVIGTYNEDQSNVISSQLGCDGATQSVDMSDINESSIQSLNGCNDSEANVSTGFHAIEFLVWGQDLSLTDAGQRTEQDYSIEECPPNSGNCYRRRAFLTAASKVLVQNIKDLRDDWAEDGALRKDLLAQPVDVSMQRVFYGMGSLALGELASERMLVALDAQDQEDEHDCFSDLTHVAIKYNLEAVNNVYKGEYGDVSGASIHALIKEKNPTLAGQIEGKLNEARGAMLALYLTAEKGKPFDAQISDDDADNKIRPTVQALADFTDLMEKGAKDVFGYDITSDPGSKFGAGS